VFLGKDLFGDIPQALTVKGLEALPDTSNFLENSSCLHHFTFSNLHFPLDVPFTPHVSLALFGTGYAGLGFLLGRDFGFLEPSSSPRQKAMPPSSPATLETVFTLDFKGMVTFFALPPPMYSTS